MIHAQNDKVVAALPAGVTASSETATLTIDTVGYDHASVTVMRAANAATTFASMLKVEESDDNASYSNVTALVGGGTGGFAIPAVSATGSVAVVKLDVDTKARKRYLKVSMTPSTAVNVAMTARLSRGEAAPETAAQAGVIGWVKG
jgi:hypothetical protein